MTQADPTLRSTVCVTCASAREQHHGCRLTNRQPRATLRSMAKKLARLSQQVRAAVDGCGVSRRRICAEIGLDESAMSRFMSGERGLSMEVLDRLGLYLGLTLRPVKPAKRAKGT